MEISKDLVSVARTRKIPPLHFAHFLKAGAKVKNIFELTKLFQEKISKKNCGRKLPKPENKNTKLHQA